MKPDNPALYCSHPLTKEKTDKPKNLHFSESQRRSQPLFVPANSSPTRLTNKYSKPKKKKRRVRNRSKKLRLSHFGSNSNHRGEPTHKKIRSKVRDPQTLRPTADPPTKTNYGEQPPLSPSQPTPSCEISQKMNPSNLHHRISNKSGKPKVKGIRVHSIHRDSQDPEKFNMKNKSHFGVKLRKSESLVGQNLARRREQQLGFCRSMRNLGVENSLNNDDILADQVIVRNFGKQRSNGENKGELDRQEPGWSRSRSPNLEHCEDHIIKNRNNERNQNQYPFPVRNMPSALSSRYQNLIQRGNVKWKSYRSLLKVESYEDANRTFEMSNHARRQNRLGAVLGVNSGESGKSPLLKAIKFCKSPRSCIDLKKNVLQRRASRIRKRGSMFQVLSKDFVFMMLLDSFLRC